MSKHPQNKKPIILIVGLTYPHMHAKFREILQKKYTIYNINLDGLNTFKKTKPKNHRHKKILFVKAYIKSFIWFLLNKKKIKKIILISGPNWHIYPFMFLSNNKIEKIYFPYDLATFTLYGNKILKFNKKLEKYNFLKADKIMHKGLQKELSYLPFFDQIKNKPIHHFTEFLNKKIINQYQEKDKLSKKDNEIHVVYGGGWVYNSVPVATNGFQTFKLLTDNNIHVHLYTKTIYPHQINMLKKFEKENPYFHYEGGVEYNELIKLYPQYDYGTNLLQIENKKLKKEIFIRTAFSNKTYDYICARLPVICLDENEAIANLIERNKIGFKIPEQIYYENKQKQKKEFNKIRNQTNLKKWKTNIEKFITKNLNNKKLIKFIN